jgi:hypothetical protein
VRLTQTIRSACKPSIIYGNEGEEVNIIANHGEVMIVENKEGNKFPVNKQFLNDGLGKISTAAKKEGFHFEVSRLEDEAPGKLRTQKKGKHSGGNKQGVSPTLF